MKAIRSSCKHISYDILNSTKTGWLITHIQISRVLREKKILEMETCGRVSRIFKLF